MKTKKDTVIIDLTIRIKIAIMNRDSELIRELEEELKEEMEKRYGKD